MPRRKKPELGDDERWAVGKAEEIRQRLHEFVELKFGGSWARLARAAGVSTPAAYRWKPGGDLWPSFDNCIGLLKVRLSLNWLVTGDGLRWGAMYLLCAAQVGGFGRHIGAFRWLTALLYPMPLIFFFVVFARSAMRSGKQVTWKGRAIRAD